MPHPNVIMVLADQHHAGLMGCAAEELSEDHEPPGEGVAADQSPNCIFWAEI